MGNDNRSAPFFFRNISISSAPSFSVIPAWSTVNIWEKQSSARAIAVWQYLIDKKGLDPASLEACGKGEYDPVASNKTASGRAKNRRVEIDIYTLDETD